MKTKSATRRKPPNAKLPPVVRNANLKIIADAVTYAQSIAAFHAGFTVDPAGHIPQEGYQTAAKTGQHHLDAAYQALGRLGELHVVTVEALHAKARLMPWVLQAPKDGMEITPKALAFCEAFALEVQEFLNPILAGKMSLSASSNGAASC